MDTKRRIPFIRLIMILLQVAGFIAIENWAAHSTGIYDRQMSETLFRVLTLLILIGMIWLFVTLHELGHLLGGLIAGQTLLLMFVGPLLILNGAKGIQFKRVDRRTRQGAGGGVSMIPASTDNLIHDRLIILAGGPGTSMLSGLFAVLIFALNRDLLSPLFAYAIACFGLMSLFFGVLNLLPIQYGALRFDGHQIFTLLRGQIEAKHDVAVLTAASLSIAGQRPSQWPPGLLDILLMVEDGKHREGVGRYLAFFYAADQGDIQAAGIYLDRALELREHFGQSGLATFLYEAAFHFALFDHDLEKAEQFYDEADGKFLFAEYVKPMAEAAIHYLKSEFDAARIKVTQARRLLDDTLDRGSALLATDWLDTLMVEITDAEAQLPASK